MNSIDLVVNFFKQGGAFLYPIAAVFAVGIAVAIERFIYLTLVARGNRRLWSQLAPQIQSGNYRKAMEIADRTDSALATIMKYGISRMATAQRHETAAFADAKAGRRAIFPSLSAQPTALETL